MKRLGRRGEMPDRRLLDEWRRLDAGIAEIAELDRTDRLSPAGRRQALALLDELRHLLAALRRQRDDLARALSGFNSGLAAVNTYARIARLGTKTTEVRK